MSEAEFFKMRLRSFFLKIKFWQDLREKDQRHTAELIRLQTVYLINIHLSKENKIQKAADLWPYPWDAEVTEKIQQKAPGMTPEQMAAAINLLKNK